MTHAHNQCRTSSATRITDGARVLTTRVATLDGLHLRPRAHEHGPVRLRDDSVCDRSGGVLHSKPVFLPDSGTYATIGRK